MDTTVVSQIRRYLRTGLSEARWQTVLQVGLTVVVAGYLLTTIDSRQAVELASSLGWRTVALVVCLTVTQYGFRLLGLYTLLRQWHHASFSTVASIDLTAKFVHLVVPSRLGGEAARPLLVRHYTGLDWPRSIAIPLAIMCATSFFTGATTVLGVWSFGARLSPGLQLVLLLSGVAYCTIGVGILSVGMGIRLIERLFQIVESIVSSVPFWGELIGDKLAAARTTVARAKDPFRTIVTNCNCVVAVTVSWAGEILFVPAIRVWVLFGALGHSFDPLVALPVVLVTAYSVTLLPLTPGGIGISEASAVLVLSALGVPVAVAGVAVSLDRLLGVYTPALLGWVPFSSTAVDELLDRVDDR